MTESLAIVARGNVLPGEFFYTFIHRTEDSIYDPLPDPTSEEIRVALALPPADAHRVAIHGKVPENAYWTLNPANGRVYWMTQETPVVPLDPSNGLPLRLQPSCRFCGRLQ